MRKKINCKVIQSRRLDLFHESRDVGNESRNVNMKASGGAHASRCASAYHRHSGLRASQIDSYA